MARKIRIVSKKDGIRRGGVAHSGTQVYPCDAFSGEQWEQIVNEPLLVVDRVEVQDEPEPEPDTAGA